MHQANTVSATAGEIGESLRLERVAANVTQLDVAQAADINRFRLLKIEKGLVQPTDDEARQIRVAIKRLGAIEAQRRAAVRRGR